MIFLGFILLSIAALLGITILYFIRLTPMERPDFVDDRALFIGGALSIFVFFISILVLLLSLLFI